MWLRQKRDRRRSNSVFNPIHKCEEILKYNSILVMLAMFGLLNINYKIEFEFLSP